MTDKPKTKPAWRRDITFEHEHPSYGLIQFSRISGGGMRLFGSAIRTHSTSIRMSVKPAMLEHSLHHDRIRHTSLDPIIEVDMSAAQFAELITSLNFSSGVPCSIRHMNGERVEDVPEIETEAERIQSSFEGSLDSMGDKMSEYRKRIESLTAKLPAKAQTEIRIALDVITDQLSSNVPFIARQFNEATDRMTSSAKAEIEAFAMHAVTVAGIQALHERAALPEADPPAAQRLPAPLLSEKTPSTADWDGAGQRARRKQPACSNCNDPTHRLPDCPKLHGGG